MNIKRHNKIDVTPFDRKRVPPRQNLFFMPLIWLYCFFATRSGKLKITRVNMDGVQPPYLLLGTHHAFMDFIVTPLTIFPHRANYISELEGFEYYGEWIYRQVGCLGTRKFVNDISLVKNIKRVTDRGDILVMYPEARYANIGTSSEIPDSVGKLAKYLGVPVVTVNMRGNYLQSPIWNLTKRKEARLSAEITQLFTAEDVKKASVDEINAEIRKHLTYDEYKWQLESNMKITYPERAKGLEGVLYQCPICGTEFSMKSDGADIFCAECGGRWYMNEYGQLELKSGAEYGNPDINYSHIPNWYEWERAQVERQIDRGEYFFSGDVHIEALPNAKNFIDCGTGELTHGENGYTLEFTECGERKSLAFSPAEMLSVHTEYDYRGGGQCITLSTVDNTYFLFPEGEGFNATKIQFATEYLHKKAELNIKNDRRGSGQQISL